MKVKSDHHSKLSNLSNWKEEAWKIWGLQRDSNLWSPPYLNKLTSLPMCGFTAAQLVEHRTSRAEVTGLNDICQASSFQLLKLEDLLRSSLFTFFYFDNGWLLHHSTVTPLYLFMLSTVPFLFLMATLLTTPSPSSSLSHVSVCAIFFAGSDLHVLSSLEVDGALLKTFKTKEQYWATCLLEITIIIN